MSESKDNIIKDTATKIFSDLCEPRLINDAEQGIWPSQLWDTLEESGLTLTWVPDNFGGAGAEMADGFTVLKVAGQFAAPVPVAETMFAGHLLARVGIKSPLGPMTVAPVHPAARIVLGTDGVLQGSARDIPFARQANHIAVIARRDGQPVIALVDRAACRVTEGNGLSGEARDTVSFNNVRPISVANAPAGFDEDGICAIGATIRCVQMAGAMQKILDQSVQYAQERVQFGRPIGKFQAVQHNLAQLAGETAAAAVAADAAAHALTIGSPDNEDTIAVIATAKVRVGEAATTGSLIAHQAHGAMGFTYEHSLHQGTRRLWSWREEFGNEAIWSIRLGRIVAARGADELWPFLAT